LQYFNNLIKINNITYSKNGTEGITSIQGGSIGTSGYDELVISTYNGMFLIKYWIAYTGLCKNPKLFKDGYLV
jgi:hypothetical protein